MLSSAAFSVVIEPAQHPLSRQNLTVPGDKSISHRYAMLAALADGETHISGYAPGADCRSTLRCLESLGVEVRHTAGSQEAGGAGPTVSILGRGWRGLQAPRHDLDAGNSGSTLRMLAGVLAGHAFDSTLVGDASLSRRPMRRIIVPLERMGASVQATDGRPPLTVRGAQLTAIDYRPDVPSAQVKSAVLFAGLHADGRTSVEEVAATRDHSERALRAFGVNVDQEGLTVSIHGGQRLAARRLTVPGDASSAAFWACAAAALPGSTLQIARVGLNPTRTHLFDVLRRAGADVSIQIDDERAFEPVGRVRINAGVPVPLTIVPSEVPELIDELPVLAALATHGGGIQVTGAGELRTKESDRIAALVAGLRAMGAEADELSDGFHVRGGRPLAGGCAVDACDDHRLAMAFAVAALGARAPVEIRGAHAVDVSYPGFFDVLQDLCG